MLIVICTICIAIVALAMICCYHLLCNVIDKHRYKKKYPHWLQLISFILFISSMLLLFMEGVIVIKKRLPSNKRKAEIYYKTRYDCIQRVLSVDKTPPYEILKEIMEYNSEIKIEQYYANSSWTNWFANPVIIRQPLIEWETKSDLEINEA